MSDSAIVEILLKARDEMTGPVDRIGRSFDGLRDHIGRIKDIALGNLLGGLGIQGIDAAISGVVDFGKSMITTNAEIEVMRQRLNVLYQSTAEGAQAFAFLKQNELTKPFNIQDILAASVQLVAFKQDITTILPALEDVAGAMGQSLPTAAQAFTDAMAGRFQMMKRDLGISKEALVSFGLEMDKRGHITNPESFVSAFLALANSNEFKGGADKLAQTWQGLMSSMNSQWTYFKANLGQGAFQVLETQLHGLVHTLQDPNNAAAIQQFEGQLGAGLGAATAAVVNFGKTLAPYVGSAIALVARAWPLVEQGASLAFGAVGKVVSAFGNWLQGTGVPFITAAIDAFGQAWHDVYPIVQEVVNNISTGIADLFTFVKTDIGPFMQGLAGAFTIGMGAVQAIFGGALDLLDGNWTKFQGDFNDGVNLIILGAVELVTGIEIALIPLADALFKPWTDFAVAMHNLWNEIGVIVGDIAGAFAWLGAAIDKPFIDAINKILQSTGSFVGDIAGAFAWLGAAIAKPVVDGLNKILQMAGNVLAHLPGFLHFGVGDAQIKAMQAGTGVGTIDPGKASADTAAAWEKAINRIIPAGGVGIGGIDPAAASAATAAAWTKWFTDHPIGIHQGQTIHAGVSEAQAIANLKATEARIIAELGVAGPGRARTFDTSGGPGADILARIKKLFAGLGGAFSMKDLLQVLGLKDLGNGKLSFSLPPGGLQVPGAGAGTDPAAAAAALAKTYVFPQSQNLGQLAASFGGEVVTPGTQDHAAERIRQLERANADLQKQNAGLQAELAQRGTEEGLLRQLAHIGDLSRGSLESLARRVVPRPPGRSPQPILGPV